MIGLLKRVFGNNKDQAQEVTDSGSVAADAVYRYVVVGAGPAGVAVVENLRRSDPEGSILLLGDEPEPPYSRMAIPYLLIGKVGEAGTHLRQQENHYQALGIQVRNARVSGIDAAAKRVTLSDGSGVQYEQLCLATGALPIRPPVPGLDQQRVYHCWTCRMPGRLSNWPMKGPTWY